MTRALDDGNVPPGFIRNIVVRVAASILMGRPEGLSTVDELEGRHVVETGALLMQRSRIIAEKVESGACAIAGVTYKLSDGRTHLQGAAGDIGELTDRPRHAAPAEPMPHRRLLSSRLPGETISSARFAGGIATRASSVHTGSAEQ